MEEMNKDEIIKQTKIFFKLAQKYGAVNDRIIENISEKILKSPASIHFGSYEGGLVQFINKYTTMAITVNNALPEGHPAKVNSDVLAKVCLIYQISKNTLYTPETEEWKIKKGQLFKYTNNPLSMGMGAKSAKFVLDYGIQLSDEEFATLVELDGVEKTRDSALTMLVRDAIKKTMFEYE